jgi:hypothetical protein
VRVLPDLAPSAAERPAASWQGSMLDGEDTAVTYPAVRAPTIRQPRAWAVVNAGKDVENRRWQTSHRGPLLTHAAKEDDPAGVAQVLPDDG